MRRIILPAALCSILSACFVPPDIVSYRSIQTGALGTSTTIVVVPPQASSARWSEPGFFSRPLQAQVPIDGDGGGDGGAGDPRYNAGAVTDWLRAAIMDEMTAKGFDVKDGYSDGPADSVRKLQDDSKRMLSKQIDESLATSIRKYCRRKDGEIIHFSFVDVTAGSDDEAVVRDVPFVLGSVSPKVRESTSIISSVIRDCRSGRRLWRADALMRQLPSPGNDILRTAVRRLHADVSTGGQHEVSQP